MTDFFDFPQQSLSSYTDEQKLNILKAFSLEVRAWYADHGRQFPWRETSDPYRILLSEMMLQQTQTQRVLPKYHLFLDLWPDFISLSTASLTDILLAWKGLGYNRRAKALKQIAQRSKEWGYTLPFDTQKLLELPMVGPATAAAVMAFSFGEPALYLETNVRRVILHYFFPDEEGVHDRRISQVLALLSDLQEEHRHWYYALMDIGVLIKASGVNPNQRSHHYTRQSPFENSLRQVRSTVLDIIATSGTQPLDSLAAALAFPRERILRALESLIADGLLVSEETADGLLYRVQED
ncbi:MAG: DNA repair protein [Sphaerochaetaceae bacterium]|nr:DNA repair protein [Sphaerochaetaceae bacterium]